MGMAVCICCCQMSAVLFCIVSVMKVCKHLVPLVQRSACIYDSGAHDMFVLHKFYVVHLLKMQHGQRT